VTGLCNVVDDDPATAADWLPALATDLGAPAPPRWDEDTARARLDWFSVHRQRDQRGAGNDRMHRELGVVLTRPSWRGNLGRP
jgi:2-alkyl-3-oxoalkanoate reductase